MGTNNAVYYSPSASAFQMFILYCDSQLAAMLLNTLELQLHGLIKLVLKMVLKLDS